MLSNFRAASSFFLGSHCECVTHIGRPTRVTFHVCYAYFRQVTRKQSIRLLVRIRSSRLERLVRNGNGLLAMKKSGEQVSNKNNGRRWVFRPFFVSEASKNGFSCVRNVGDDEDVAEKIGVLIMETAEERASGRAKIIEYSSVINTRNSIL